ncbi:MAG: ethylbenzene dehydrogenase-related protein [Chloroflexi bacterium]|nr:ethylbenzene dehydrogenase-related protein [Chloroflexota bacterium]
MKRFTLLIGLILAAMLMACGGSSEPEAAVSVSEPNTLTAVKVDATTLEANAAYWANAPVLEVDTQAAVEGNPDGPVVKMQAVYDGQYIVIRSEWADPSESLLKAAWTWDGAAFTKSGDEDRVMITWPIGNNAEFASKGCGVACHNTSEDQEEWWMGSEDPNVRYDSWHWKSSRTNIVGYADDQWWNVLEDPADVASSRRSDTKDSGGYSDNVNETKDGPLYMSGTDLSSPFILKGDEVEIDTAALTAGMVIPGFVVSKPVGSRGDIEAVGTWENGVWVVVQRRLLSTGFEDDITFTPPKSVPFGLAVVDNGGGLPHTIGADVLTLIWK